MLLLWVGLSGVDISGLKDKETLGKLNFITGEGESGYKGDNIFAGIFSWHFSPKLTHISPPLQIKYLG